MILRVIIPLIALFGFAMGVFFTFQYGNPPAAIATQLTAPPATPFEKTVSGTGIVEANTRNIEVGSHLSGVVADVLVAEGQMVKEGDPLFIIDDQAARANLDKANEEVAVAETQIKQAATALDDNKDQLTRAEGLKAGSSISVDTLQRRRFAVKSAEAALAMAKAERGRSAAMLEAAQVDLRLHTMKAPVTGRILKINIREGEYVNLMGGGSFIVMGNDRPLHLRVQIDENDLWRYNAKSEAQASLRSNKDIAFPLKFVRVEPYVMPKNSLSGDTSERVDTRVLEVVYSFDPKDEPVFIGQQLDVFIKAAD